MLSLTGVKEGLRGHVVVELSDVDNEPLVKLVGGELTETVVAHDVIGRLMIQCALQPGLAQVLTFFFDWSTYKSITSSYIPYPVNYRLLCLSAFLFCSF